MKLTHIDDAAKDAICYVVNCGQAWKTSLSEMLQDIDVIILKIAKVFSRKVENRSGEDI
jgi:hypothetical protein